MAQITLNSTGVASNGTLALQSNGTTTAVTIDASQNVGIGESSPNGRLSVKRGNDGIISYFDGTTTQFRIDVSASTIFLNAQNGNAAMAFQTNSVERARIDSSGNFLVGVTSAPAGSGTTVSNATASTWAFRAQNTTASFPVGILVKYTVATPNNGGQQFLYCEDATAIRAAFSSNGGLVNYQANDANLSDRREKTNFAPAKSYLDVICSIPVQTFNYIDQNMEEDGGLTLGVVAQDVQAVAPELVTERNWASKDKEPKMRLSIYQTDLQYALMKALQELNAKFEAYKASHP
jgi:hypothetical protein